MKNIFYFIILLNIFSFKPLDSNECIDNLFKQTDPADKGKYEKSESKMNLV